ncbi:helix-turn-helix domain-containing protein [Citrobacter freundii]|uniref:helix-turn-helix domain-containing protein n=1 Tax=Citrobacter sp. wls711 TaxID=2576425 RepID=UPI000BBCFE2C|nr:MULTISPECIES: helix-turn-helix domain-containing protein [Citrobacter]HEE0107190.1 helix-turn-helix domain-containing protein [Citrobacter gillenii]ATF48762.1 DNA-binding protein [Citrobacter werkmanii]EJB8470281.1 helix-turn-helix domain-containing protein [Citrobacter freundii]EJB8557388.1 helix-turn-helix domain-containing protein [Citrobacter freundii]MBA8034705.1 helix-turn-helix domain-containing protein [Citrobacter freundii]
MEHKSQDWHRADIKSALEKRGITLRDLSRAAGLSPDSLRNVFTRSWPRAESIIAKALGTTPEAIWPSRYDGSRTENKTDIQNN